MHEIIEILTNNHQTIATMESCTGGALASYITNYSGSSRVLKFSAVTYSNEYKIKMGVDPKIIEQYTVYSQETADAMAEAISDYAQSDYGIGITGKFNEEDPANRYGDNAQIYIAIYIKEENKCHHYQMQADAHLSRAENKQMVIDYIVSKLEELLVNKKV